MGMLKAFSRDAYAQLLYRLGLAKPSRFSRGDLLILTFHRVLPEDARREYPLPGLAVTPTELRWILAFLAPHFEIRNVTESISVRADGTQRKPLLAVTFDDGQWDNLEYAAPVLSELGVPATFYIPTQFIGSDALLWHDQAAFAWQRSTVPVERRVQELIALGVPLRQGATPQVASFLETMKAISPEMRQSALGRLQEMGVSDAPPWARLMDWQEVAKLARAGHEIGSHSQSHALLPQLEPQQQLEELVGSKRHIETAIGAAIHSLCYPNGSFDARTVQIARDAGYDNAVTTRWGTNKSVNSRFELLRCDMDAARMKDRHGRLSHARLAMRITGLQPGL